MSVDPPLFNANLPKTTSAALIAAADQEVGVSRWFTIDQARIDAFAKITEDEYFIHTNPVRAKAETPFGGAIAHGFLILSMLSALAYDALPDIEGRRLGMNYGFDKIRFLRPTPAGSRIRGRFKIIEAVQKKPRELVIRYAVSVEIEGEEKPALIAEWVVVAFFG